MTTFQEFLEDPVGTTITEVNVLWINVRMIWCDVRIWWYS